MDHIVGAWSELRSLDTALEGHREAIGGRVEALVLLSTGLLVESSFLSLDWVRAWTSQTSEVLFLHEVHLLLLFGLVCLWLHLKLLGQVLEVERAPVFVKLALDLDHVLDLLHLDRLNLI